MKRLLRFAALSIVGAAVFAAVPAYAFKTGQCMAAEQARQEIAAERMSPIIVGNRSGYGHPTALIFFANADGSKGYALLADKPVGEQASTICVQSVYRDIHLNDFTNAGVPAWARMPVDRPRAVALCRKGGLGYRDKCMPYDASLRNLEGNGAHVMLIATGTAINPRDNSVRSEQRIVVTVLPGENLGGIDAVTAEGASYMLSAYSAVRYTQDGAARLAR